MARLSEDKAIALASKCLDSEHIRNPKEDPSKAEELCQFWFWNPPAFTNGQPDWWGEWMAFGLIDPEAGDEGKHKMSADMARYFVERSETDRDYWDALRKIIATTLDRSGGIESPNLRTWLIGMLNGQRKAPPKKPGNPALKYHARNGCIYFAMVALYEDGPMSQASAAKWVGKQIDRSPEAITTIYRNACKS